MSEFFHIILSFPTVLFTVPLGLMVLYWLLVILGGIDVDFFDSVLGLDVAEIGEVVEGADTAEAVEAHAGGFASLLQLLGLAGVPFTIPLSFLVLFGWILTYFGTVHLGSLAPDDGWLATVLGLVVATLAFGLSLFATAQLVQPLRPVFQTHLAPQRRAFVGTVATIRTQTVNAEFGQAEIDDGGAGLLVDVRCLDENTLTRGSSVLIYDYDAAREVYLVTPADDVLTPSARES